MNLTMFATITQLIPFITSTKADWIISLLASPTFNQSNMM